MIGIIAVLIGVLLPVLGKARKSAYKIQCMSTLRQFAMADQQYINVSHDWHLPGYWDGPVKGFYAPILQYSWPGIAEFRRMMAIPVVDESTDIYDGGNGKGNKVVLSSLPQKWLCPNSARGFTTEGTLNGTDYWANYVYGMNVEGVDAGVALDSFNAPHWGRAH